MALWTIDINKNREYSWTMDSDMVHVSRSGNMSPWLQLAVQVTQISLHPAAAWAWKTNMAFGNGPDPRHPHGPWWQKEPHILVIAGSQTSSWSQLNSYNTMTLVG